MARQRTRRHRKHPRRYSPRIIVVGEGDTEYNYFATFNQVVMKTLSERAALVPKQSGQAGSPQDVVRAAIRIRNDDPDYDPRQGDRCYCVIDVEPHDPARVAKLDDVRELAEQHGIGLILSNPSFEVWLLCHVVSADYVWRTMRDAHTADAELVKRCGVGKLLLNKNSSRFRPFVERARDAVKAACDLHRTRHRTCADLRDANPCTEVYRLIQFLLGEAAEAP